MMRYILLAPFALLAMASACTSDTPATPGVDAGPAQLTCQDDAGCPDAMICAGNVCVARGCDPACGEGLKCIHAVCAASASALCSSNNPTGLCPTGQSCTDGLCCAAGAERCGANCSDLATDAANCGACGKACGSGEVCEAGKCGCSAGDTACNGACVTLATDASNCGACGNVCTNGQQCLAGRCQCPSGWLECGGKCVDPKTDEAHCGACNTACAASQRCNAGTCGCESNERLCGGQCVATATDPANCGACGAVCAEGLVCREGSCTCPPGLSRCGDRCVDTRGDAAHCGSCGSTCAATLACVNGACGCPQGLARCESACVDTGSDPSNCGGCGTACLAGQRCNDGQCACAPGTVACGDRCVDTDTDGANCGTCGNSCAAGLFCIDGQCGCPSGWLSCDGRCVDPSTTEAHCGACGNACAAGKSCKAGACGCEPGETYCGSACVTTATDEANCGRCGNACAPGLACVAGSCTCPSGQDLCGGKCVDRNTDGANCGACGNACGPSLACVSGACGCPQGLTKCGNACVDIARDVRHCGACGTTCGANQACDASRCVSTIPPGQLAGTLNPSLPASTGAARPGATGAGLVSPHPPSAIARALANGLRTTNEPDHLAGALSVKLASPAQTPDAVLESLSPAGLRLRFRRSVSPHWHSVIVVDAEGKPVSDAELERAANLLRGLPAVRHVERVGTAKPLAVPTDPYAAYQWHYEYASLPGAWDVTTGRATVTVAVIDDGIIQHPDFGSRLLPGYDFVSDAANAGDGNGQDSDPTRPAIFPDGRVSFHGTHVAGTIGAASNNGIGIAGVDWTARVLPVRALGLYGGTRDDIAAAMRWSAGLAVPGVPNNPNPAKVINMSLGGEGWSQEYQDAIDEINAAGGIIVVAAGNEDEPAAQKTPAGQSGVITVGAVGKDALRSSYSNYGSAVDVMAPGGDFEDIDRDGIQDGILSLFGDSLGRPAYDYSNGTSMASPHVAGIVALMAAVDPTIDSARAEAILRSTAWSQFQCAEGCGAGLVNAHAAVLMAKGVAQAIGPRLLATPFALEMGSRVTEIVKIRNVGAVDLHFVAEPRGAYAANSGLARTTGTVAPNQSMDLQLRIDRTGLANGIYPLTIVVRSDGGNTEIPVSFRVGPRPVPTLSVHAITLAGGSPRTVASATTTETGSWQWSMSLPPGEYYLVAGTDDDNDGKLGEEGEYYGAWPVASDPQPIRIYAQQTISSLDFATARRDVVPVPGPGQFEEACTDNANCASLNCLRLSETSAQCTITCGPGTACPGGYWCGEVFNTVTGAGSEACRPKYDLGETCAVDDQCLSGRCFASATPACVRGCTQNAECGAGKGCRTRIDLNGRSLDVCVDLHAIGDACTLDSQCGNPGGAICATNWPSGYCFSDCSTTACPGGSTCVSFAGGTSYCLDSCSAATDCRPGYSCYDLGDGRNVCFGEGGAACTDESSCYSTEFCDEVLRQCRSVTNLTIRLASFSAIIAATPAGGGSWDAFGGAPDPIFKVFKGTQLVATSGAASDTYTPAWSGGVSVTVSDNDFLAIVVEDSDLTTNDPVDTFYVFDLVKALRDGFFTYTSSGNLRSFSFTVAPQ